MMELRITMFEREDRLEVDVRLRRDGSYRVSNWLSDGPCELQDALKIVPRMVERLERLEWKK